MIAQTDNYPEKCAVLSIYNLKLKEEAIYYTKWTLYEPKNNLLFLLSNAKIYMSHLMNVQLLLSLSKQTLTYNAK